MIDFTRRSGELTRRRFGALSLGAGLTMMLPAVVGAVDVTESDIEIKTPDGTADSYFVHPASGAHPGIVMWTDIMGLRPAFKMMGKRLAESGYSVLVPNPFYRTKKAPVVPAGATMQDEETRKTLMSLMGSLTAATNVVDAKAFVGFLDSQRTSECPSPGTALPCPGTSRAQIAELTDIMATARRYRADRALDLVLLTIGANDILFSKLIANVIVQPGSERSLLSRGGIIAFVLWPDHWLWLERGNYRNSLIATFINPNVAAVYFGACTITWLLLLANAIELPVETKRLSIYQFLGAVLFNHPKPRTICYLCAMFIVLSACASHNPAL